MIRHYHRLMKMSDTRLTKIVMLWDKKLNDSENINTWSSEVHEIFTETNMQSIYTDNVCFDKKDILSKMSYFYMQKQKLDLEAECQLKPKLRTFLRYKDFSELAAYIHKPLTFPQRRMMAKVRLGCLPLRLETGRYARPRLEERERVCLVCKPKDQLIDIPGQETPIESETHFLFYCNAYSAEREQLLKKLTIPDNFYDLNDDEKLKATLNDPLNVRFTSQFILSAFNLRSIVLNQ